MVADGNAPRPTSGNSGDRFSDPTLQQGDGVAAIGLRVREVVEFASYYLTAQLDRLRLTAINLAMFAVLGFIAAFVGAAVVLTAGVLLVVGMADGLGALFGERYWLGDLVTAIVILGTLCAGTIVVFKKVTKSSRERLVAAYEQRKSQQRADLGTDVEAESRR
jgi:hypothetical protein